MDFLSPTFAAFLLAAIALAITPGPGIAYVVARTVAGGKPAGLASCAGTAVGGLGHVLAAALGLSALVAQSASLFAIVKYAGAAYLIYLGIRALRASESALPGAPVSGAGTKRAFTDGVLVEILNVKTAIFFLAFIPQFVDPAHSIGRQFIVLGSICVLLNTAVDVLAVWFAARLLAHDRLMHARARLLNRCSGITMLALGAFVLVQRNER
jgi:threonine/homoserine/homoserine lactone efflux protein